MILLALKDMPCSGLILLDILVFILSDPDCLDAIMTTLSRHSTEPFNALYRKIGPVNKIKGRWWNFFRTISPDVIKECRCFFGIADTKRLIAKCEMKFLRKFCNSEKGILNSLQTLLPILNVKCWSNAYHYFLSFFVCCCCINCCHTIGE